MRRTLCVVLAGLVILGACGGDDDDSQDSDSSASDSASESDSASAPAEGGVDDYVSAAVDAIGADMEDAALTEEVVGCIATALVETIGVDTFEAAGVGPDDLAEVEEISELDLDLPDTAVADMTTRLEGCDLSAAFAALLVSGFTEVTGEPSEGAEQCLTENMDNAELAALAAQETLDPSGEEESDDLDTVLATALGSCPDALSELIIGSFESGLGTELSSESRDCLGTFVEANAAAVAEGFMDSGDEQSEDILGTDLMAACPTLATQIGEVTGESPPG